MRNGFKSGLIWLWIAVCVILVDQISKYYVMRHLLYQQPIPVLPFFNLTLAYNKGAAFGFLHAAAGWQNIFLGSLATIVGIVIVIWLSRLPRRDLWFSVALCFILGGALGNLCDRLHYGYVIDFLSFHLGDWYFAIFNLADSAIFIGACMIILSWLRDPKN